MNYPQLIDHYPIISDQITADRLSVVLRELERALTQKVSGDIVELGCYIGSTSVFLRRVLNEQGSQAALHVYDSFSGLPPKSIQDASPAGTEFKAGELKVGKKDLVKAFKKAGLQLPIIHKAWFDQLKPTDVPEQIAFAFLDGDFYDSILTSLHLVWPRLSPGGVITVDDYARSALPGVERAVHDFFQGKDVSLRHEHNIAIIAHHTS